jgi:beta-ureidopropionase / N-carbamoyl-L-amino-acid hydrolase
VSFAELWESLLPIGLHPPSGGYRRFSFTPAEAECRAWFTDQAAKRNLRVHPDRNANLWAWWDHGAGQLAEAGGQAVVTGSHLDSVPDGGAFDGPLGIVSAFAAIDQLRAAGFRPSRPITVAAFAEEEGGRFGTACLGSRLLTGAIEPDAARALTDGDGIRLADAMTGAGFDPGLLGPDTELTSRIGAFVELHVEQGRALEALGAPVGIAERIWPHGRWLLRFDGRADHAGTTRLEDRQDPMLPYAATVLAARQAASEHSGLATIGKVNAVPGAANAISSVVRCWLDARAPADTGLEEMVRHIVAGAEAAAMEHEVRFSERRESVTEAVEFDRGLREQIAATLAGHGITAPVIPTGAGHDAGVLAAIAPTAMLFVRNPTGVSHAPAEHADPAACEAGVTALAAVLAELAG